MLTISRDIDRVILDSNSYANAIKMIFKNFIKMKAAKKYAETGGSLVIDIQLLAKRDFYMVQITHCGGWTDKGIENIFNELCLLVKNGQLPNKMTHAYIFERHNGQEDETAYVLQGAPDFVKKKIMLKDKFVHFPSFKNYVLIQLQYKLLSNDLSQFKDILLQDFNILTKTHQDVKIMFYSEKDIFYNNNVGSDVDFKNCELLSLPLIAVIKQSMNTGFKERCLETLQVQSIHDAQKILTRTLFSMTHENYMIP